MNINLDEMPQRERLELFARLARMVCGPIPITGADGETWGILPLSWSDKILVGVSQILPFHCQARFKPQRLVILESIVEREKRETVIDYEPPETEERLVTGVWDDVRTKRMVRIVVKEGRMGAARHISHRTEERIDRAKWMVESIYIGNYVQFPARGSIPGEAFGPDGKLDFDGYVCEVGMPISIVVRHSCTEPVPFNAVLLGKFLPPKYYRHRR